MLYNALQKMLVGAVVLSFAATSQVTAAGNVSVIADFENATNENYWGQYIYLYDDHKDKGNTKITNQVMNLTDSTYNFLPVKDVGNTVTGGTPGYGAEVDFTFGSTNPGNASATWGSMVGIGCMFASEGSFMDLTGADKIEFYAKIERPKGTASTVDMRVEVCTQELDADFGYYHTIVQLSGTWTKCTIPLDTVDKGYGKLIQWDWSVTNGGKKPFNKTKVSKIQFCISEDGNVTAWKDASAALFIDDITISPFTPHFYDEIEAAKLGAPGAAGLLPTNMICDFEASGLKNALGYYGYCYTDADANPSGPSAIILGATTDSTTGKPKLTLSDGGVTAGSCASISFQLGTTYLKDGNTVMPFVGIGTNLVPTDASGGAMDVCNLGTATAVYFDYKLQSPTCKFVTFEYGSAQSFGNSGAVYYVKLPSTNGEWKGATVDLSATATELVLPKWKDVTPTALDKSKTTTFKWKVQGAAHSEGTLAIDNIYVPGYTPAVIHFGNKPVFKSAFTVKQLGNAAQVSFILPQNVSNARVDLVSMLGKVLASQSVLRSGAGKYQVAFPTGCLANGSYFVKINYDNKDAKSAMISVIK
jgi:hypothetical protein